MVRPVLWEGLGGNCGGKEMTWGKELAGACLLERRIVLLGTAEVLLLLTA